MYNKQNLLGESLTKGYRPSILIWPAWMYSGLQTFTLADVEVMRRDYQIHLGLEYLKAPLYTLEWMVKCKNKEVAKYVDKNLHLLWKPNIYKILNAMEYGYSGGEMLYRLIDNKIYIRTLKDIHPRDLRVLSRDREFAGLRVKNVHTASGDVDLFNPKGFWFAVNRRFSSFYGRSYLMNCWDSWFEKRSKDGAIDIRRLWFYKNAFHGGVIRHPAKDYVMPDGQIIPARQMAQEMGERLKTGGVIALPNTRDEKGEYHWEYKPPQINAVASEIREYPRDLDVEIFRGLGIPDNVLVEQPGTSSYAGRRVPERAFYVSLEKIVSELMYAIKYQILDHLVKANFAGEHEYEIITKPIVEIMSPEGSESLPSSGDGNTIGEVFSTDDEQGFANMPSSSAAASPSLGV